MTDEIIFDKRNYRKHNAENKRLIKKSLEECGAGRSILIDGQNEIIAGNGVYEQAQKLNMPVRIVETDGSEIVAIKRTDLKTDDEKRKQLAVMDNSTSDSSEFNLELLSEDFDVGQLDDFGIDVPEVEEDISVEEVDVPDECEKRCKLGDVWQLGNHRLMCGDSTIKKNVIKFLENKKIDTLLTDPPYNMNYSGRGFLKENTLNCRERIKNMLDFNPEKIDFIKNFDIGSYYFFTNKDLILKYMSIFKEYKFNLLCWCKYGVPPFINNNFYSDIEYILYFHNGKRVWNNGLFPLDIYKKYYVSSAKEGKKEVGDLHPTMKPIELLANQIKISSNKNGNVLDLFGGSGSTLIACEQMGRICYMMELDEHYCDVILQRFENFTGTKPVLLERKE